MGDDLLDDMGVLSFGDTISEHDDLLGKVAGLGLESSEMVGGHTGEIGDNLSIVMSVEVKTSRRGMLFTFCPLGVGWQA